MKKVTAITLTAFVLLLASAMAVSAVDRVEIRGPVATVENANYTWDAQDFAGFYYDIDDDIGTESITLTITGDALDEPEGIKYETTAQKDDFDYEEWGQYWTIGFLADEYFASYVEGGLEDQYLYYDSTDENLMVDEQLSKILMDDDEERTFTTGTPLKLAGDYELAIQAIDLDGNKVYVQLMKDGKVVDSAVVEPSKDNADVQDKTYTYTMDLGDTEDVVVVGVHFKNAFRGADQDLATVDGIWQIADTYTDVEEDTEYDKMTIQTVNADTKYIMMDNEDNKVTLNKNKDTLLMENIRIKTADQDDIVTTPLRFYIYKEITEPGTYEIRGSVAEVVDGTVEWDYSSFAGFYYDIDDNLGTERIVMTITGDALDEPEGIKYETTAQKDDFEYEEWGQYWTIGFLADEYFASYVEGGLEDQYLYYDSTDENLMVDEQLSKILMDDDEEMTFTTGTPLKLEDDYELAIEAIDLDGNKVYVQLMKDGKVVDSAVVEPSKDNADVQDKTYTYTMDLGDTEDLAVIAVHFKNAFRGSDQDLATVDGIWQIADTYTDVEEDTEYDKMTIQTVDADTKSIMMDNEDNKITLNKNKDTLLMENIRIKTADQDDIVTEPLRFYIYEEATIEADMAAEPAPEPVKAPETSVEPAPAAEEPVAEEPAAEEPMVEEPMAEETEVEEPVEETKEETGGIPGFEAVFAITGLLAVSYLVLRKRE
ncbi:MAG TPA: PGF-CTERM sorting domain-containing protein [Methanotrichaceae archaeon]|nr:PGF-CTERM sorting domain-containing protein [Methanotrichaceae archaeon]